MQCNVLIIGFGLAGWALTEVLKKEGISFTVYDTKQFSSSRVATGIYNPVALKRFRAIWNANTLMEQALLLYKQPKYIHTQHPMPIYRVFAAAAEHNEWAVATDKYAVHTYLKQAFFSSINAFIKTPYGLGEVQHTGWVDTNALLDTAKKDLLSSGCFVEEQFNYDALSIIASGGVQYKNMNAQHVVFAEGVGVLNNPWFSNLPVIPNKGEWLIVSCEGLGLRQMIKGSVFIVPLGNDVYRVGATYARDFVDEDPSLEGKEWLVSKFEKLVTLPFTVLSHGAGLRPTTTDRKPILGQHSSHASFWCVNGLGSRGVLWAPYLATLFVNALKGTQKVPQELDVRRFLTP